MSFDAILSFAIVAVIFAVSDFISSKTRAVVSMLFAAVVFFIIGFWSNLFPKDIFNTAGITGIGTMLTCALMINMGTLLNIKEILQQWKTVIVGLAVVILGGTVMFFLSRIFIGTNLAVATVGPITGGMVAAMVVSDAATPLGLTQVSLLATIIVAVQGVVGYPLGSFFLRLEGQRLLKNYRNGTFQWTHVDSASMTTTSGKKGWKLPSIPKQYNTSYVMLAKVSLAVLVSNRLSTLTGINQFIICLVVGILLHEINFLENDIVNKASAYGLCILAAFSFLVMSINNVTPQMLLEMIGPVLVAFICGIIGLFSVALVFGKIVGYSWQMSLALATTCFYGFPGTLVLANEVSEKLGANDEEVTMLKDNTAPYMIVAGFVTLTIVSVFISGVFVKFLIA